MSMKEIDKENATKPNATRDNVYIIDTIQMHTNKFIEHDPSESTTISMREKEIDKYANANARMFVRPIVLNYKRATQSR